MKNRFTIIEFLVVAAIVGIILAVFVPIIFGIKEGEVVDKRYVPEKTWVSTQCTTNSNGNTMCSPVTHYDPEKFIIKIRKYDEGKDEYKYRSLNIRECKYNDIKIGDWFKIGD